MTLERRNAMTHERKRSLRFARDDTGVLMGMVRDDEKERV